jgi:hypothetical protein
LFTWHSDHSLLSLFIKMEKALGKRFPAYDIFCVSKKIEADYTNPLLASYMIMQSKSTPNMH